MASTRAYWVLLIFLAVYVYLPTLVLPAKFDFQFCKSIVGNWASSTSASSPPSNLRERDKTNLKDLLFFLHVPRTGGRAYFHCLLRKMYKNHEQCPRSYDKLNFDPSTAKCHLISTHDDYSLMQKLSEDRTSVVTILRNPIDRVFSTYEFSVEVAARFLVHPNITSVRKMSVRIRPKTRGISTLDIWPWKYLVVWMREDLFARRDRRDAKQLNLDTFVSESDNPYNMEEIAMPLLEFINSPMSHDIVHNGATYQIVGLTNNSGFADAHGIRHCVSQHPSLGHYVLEVAKRRLDNMLFVGLTEEHRKSAIMFSNMAVTQVISQSESSSTSSSDSGNSPSGGSNNTKNSTFSAGKREALSAKNVNAVNGNMTVAKVIEAYGTCMSDLRRSITKRRNMSLKRIAPVMFSKEARKLVPETLLQQILTLNSLDVELYKYGQGIFGVENKHLETRIGDEKQHIVPDLSMARDMADGFLFGYFRKWEVVVLVALALLVLVFLLYFVSSASRQTSKLKQEIKTHDSKKIGK